MRAWLLSVASRIGDLFIKLIAMKFLACGILTYLYAISGEKNAVMFGIISSAWMTAVGLRAYEKKNVLTSDSNRNPARPKEGA